MREVQRNYDPWVLVEEDLILRSKTDWIAAHPQIATGSQCLSKMELMGNTVTRLREVVVMTAERSFPVCCL